VDQDKNLTCSDCGAEFVFSAKDQAYYTERGFVAPKRCKPCREAKKAAGPSRPGGGGGGGGYGGGGGGAGGGNRAVYDATCASCGQPTTVPFRPVAGRPVYCRDCYRGGSAGGPGGGGGRGRH
jgi:CxxC-x17-CxxC domain-containing protein